MHERLKASGLAAAARPTKPCIYKLDAILLVIMQDVTWYAMHSFCLYWSGAGAEHWTHSGDLSLLG